MLADDGGNFDLVGSSGVSQESSKELVKTLTEHLSNKFASKAVEIIKKPEFAKDVKDASWDIVRIVSDYLTDDNVIKSKDICDCCGEILEEVARIAVPEEAIIEFLEQAEQVNNDIKFLSMLKPLQIVLNRLQKRKAQSLGFCLNTIKTYIKSLPVPEEQNLEGDEKLLMDADPHVQRISDIYSEISHFYRPFVKAAILKEGSNIVFEETSAQEARESLICFLFHILEKPIVYLDLECREDTPKSTQRVAVEEIVTCLQDLVGDLLLFLEYSGPLEEPYQGNNLADEEEKGDGGCLAGVSDLDSVLRRDGVPLLSVSMLYYLVFAEGQMLSAFPAVYDPIFVFRSCVFHASIFMKHQEVPVLRKGLLLSRKIINNASEGQIPAAELDSPVYSNFINVLTNTMVYCGVEECRKIAGLIFKNFIFKFDSKGRYLLMANLQKTVNHSGTLGYIIMILKEITFQALSHESHPPYFSGKCWFDLLSGYFRLPHGAESDLVEITDEILSALNVLKFFFMYDNNNRSGLWDHMDYLDKNFFVPLREGLKLSQAHYKLKIRQLEEEKDGATRPKKSKVSITVGCQQLPDVPYDQKIFFINTALNGFHLMECLLSEIHDCIKTKTGNKT